MHLCPVYNRRLMSHTAYAPLPGANYVAFSCCHIIANEYRLSMLFALLPYVVGEEVLLGTRLWQTKEFYGYARILRKKKLHTRATKAWRFYPRKLKNRYTYPTPSKSASKNLVFSGLSRGKSVTPAACFFEYSWHLILTENRNRKERCNAFDPQNWGKGKNILPPQKSP